jgi:hypothetical protein
MKDSEGQVASVDKWAQTVWLLRCHLELKDCQ